MVFEIPGKPENFPHSDINGFFTPVFPVLLTEFKMKREREKRDWGGAGESHILLNVNEPPLLFQIVNVQFIMSDSKWAS